MSKRSPTPPNIRDRKKLRKIQTLLNTLRDRVPNMNSTLKRKLGIQDRTKVTQLIDALNELDMDFTFENCEKLYLVIENLQLSQLQHKYVKRLDKTIDGEIQIKEDTDIVEATSKVLLNCEYLGDDCVVKVMNKKVHKMDLIIETIINIFMFIVTKNDVNEYISCPDVITMGYLENFNLPRRYHENAQLSGSFSKKKDTERQMTSIIVQEKISGEVFHNIDDELVLVQALQQLCRGLDILQDRYNFAHKDFHADNVMYNTVDGRVYIIDFGFSCFSVPDTKGSIQSLMGGYGINQLDDDYKAHIPCINKSSDLCTLLLSLCYKNEYDWLDIIAEAICRKYRRKARRNKYTKGFLNMDRKVPEGWKWGDPIFHHWYIYELFQIDINLTPKVLLRILTKVEKIIMEVRRRQAQRRNTLLATLDSYQKLKF
tara:strand:+ start:151 stop:1434 length:1284 start_codon:yes stop_codon:yes gene_type:complete